MAAELRDFGCLAVDLGHWRDNYGVSGVLRNLDVQPAYGCGVQGEEDAIDGGYRWFIWGICTVLETV